MRDLYHECEEVLSTTGSEERELLGVGSIPVEILPSCQDMKNHCIIMQRD